MAILFLPGKTGWGIMPWRCKKNWQSALGNGRVDKRIVVLFRVVAGSGPINSKNAEVCMSRSVFRHTVGCLLFLLLGALFAASSTQAAEAGGASTFVKLDASGNELATDAVSWAMVKDTKTGLIWEMKTTDGSVHDAGNQYTWKEAKEVFLVELNNAAFGGFTDWRMPNDTELKSIMRQNQEEPFVDTAYFPNLRPANYWNFYICGSGATMSDTKSFGKKSVRSAKQHAIAVRGKEQ